MGFRERPVSVLCDFDGTITNDDIGFRIIQAFAGPGWQEIEDEYQRGQKGSREAMQEIFSLTRVPEDELRRFVEDNFYIDPYFGKFLQYCRRSDMPVTVLSDGFDFYIDLMLQKFRVEVPYLANRLRVVDCSLEAEFPLQSDHCGACGNCKMNFVRQVKDSGALVIYIGDGYSDRCASKMADIVFAKSVLAEHLTKEGRPFYPFCDFSNILENLNSGLPELAKTYP